MLKKPLFLIGLFGLILMIAGIILSPSFIGKFTEGGGLTTVRGIVAVNLFQFYLITFGIVIILESLVISFLIPKDWISRKENRSVIYVSSAFLAGAILLVTGVIFKPSFIEHKLNFFTVDESRVALLSKIQMGIITFGCLIVFISLFIYRRKFLNRKIFGTLILIGILFMYIILVKVTYINNLYTLNILAKPNEYKKAVNLLLGRDILLSDFSPQSQLKVERKEILKAKFPVIDVHFHLASPFMTEEDKKVLMPENLIKNMDTIGLKVIVGFDANDDNLDMLLSQYQRKFPGRFLVLSDMFSYGGRVLTDEFLSSLPSKLEKFKKLGMCGIGELPKDLGLKIEDTKGRIISLDDPRLDSFFEKAGELHLPILIHTGDPSAFFLPVNRFNERYSELGENPSWSYSGSQFPTKETLLKQRENVLKKHPNTIFVGCHFGSNSEDLHYVGYMLDKYPNYYVDMSAVLSDLGRQPYTARKFFIKYQDRILFGTDGGIFFGLEGWTIEKIYRSYFEFLETENEYIDYPQKGAINQGNWQIYGINLPDEVLQKIYYKNAEKIFLSKSGEKVNVEK